MSKAALKKELQKLSKEQLISQLLELYDSYKPVKEFYDFYLKPNEKELYEKYKKIVVQEFYPTTKVWDPKMRFSVAKKAISDFKALKPSPSWIADLMLTLPETACRLTYEFGDMSESFYTSTVVNFEKALIFIKKAGLLNDFKRRCEDCLKHAEPCGYNFPYEMEEVYFNFYDSKN